MKVLIDNLSESLMLYDYIYCLASMQLANQQRLYHTVAGSWVMTDDWWLITRIWLRRHQMETFSTLLAICAGNSPIPGEFPAQRPVTLGFDVFFDLCLNQQLSKQWRRHWFETPLCSLWCHCNDQTPYKSKNKLEHCTPHHSIHPFGTSHWVVTETV